MAISEFEIRRVEKLASEYIDTHRPPAHIRAQLDIGFRVTDQSLEFFDIRPRWDNPSEILEHPFAKTTFVKKSRTWKVYWMRQDLKWHSYEPAAEVNTLEEALSVVSEDAFACFRG
ncbi:MAG: DUF3024 domain-containing protein [Halioglobus sp.]